VHWKHEKLPEEMKLRKAPVALELPADVQANQQSVQQTKQTATGATTPSKLVSQLMTQSALQSVSTLLDPKIKQSMLTGESQDNSGSSGGATPTGLASDEAVSEKRGRKLSIFATPSHISLERREV
jgi:hypothetical protein